MFTGLVEMDETNMGGKQANIPKSKRVQLSGRETVGKPAIMGAKDLATNQARVVVVKRTEKFNKKPRRVVETAEASCQPARADMGEGLDVPEITPEETTGMVMKSVDVKTR